MPKACNLIVITPSLQNESLEFETLISKMYKKRIKKK